ncbi:MAG: bis(5'-nucleosyl)-tetraphosphatase (symmetrical) YqeK [Firmicutes bacterium]|nr:bis(5'-nucleosyl)-tetraphosphatase (symmetrical) YqeK [Bacillota bacterium]
MNQAEFSLDELRRSAQSRLSPKRFAHVEGVAHTAARLAPRFDASVHQALQAAWLHDMYKETGEAQLQALGQQVGEPLEMWPVAAWHGVVCAARMCADFGVCDEVVAAAVRHHTTGHPDMSTVGLALFVADAIEPGRDYQGVERLRVAAADDVWLAAALCADVKVRSALAAHYPLLAVTVELRNKLWARVRSNAGESVYTTC